MFLLPPSKKKKRKENPLITIKQTWLAPGLHTSIRTKNDLYKEYKNYPFLSHERAYKNSVTTKC